MITVRHATADDGPSVIALFALLGHSPSMDDPRAQVERFLESGECVVVAERDGEVVGATSAHVIPLLHRAGPIGRYTAVVVREDCRGNGVGRVMLEFTDRELRGRGCVHTEVTSNISRTRAHEFYQRLGYERTSYRFAKELEGGE